MYESSPSELPSPSAAYKDAIGQGYAANGRSMPDYRASLQVMTAYYERAYRQVHQLLRDLGKVVPPSRRTAAEGSGACLGYCCESRSLIGCRPTSPGAASGEVAR